MAGKPVAVPKTAAGKEDKPKEDKPKDDKGSVAATATTGDEAAVAGEAEPPVPRHGTFAFSDGAVYEGEFQATEGGSVERHGRGRFQTGPECYDGDWEHDRMHGRGRFEFATGAVYDGEFAADAFHGAGAYAWRDGAAYTGGWAHGRMHGDGVYTDKDGVAWRGRFVNGKFDNGRIFHELR